MTSSLYNIYHGSLSITHQRPDPPHHSSYLSTFSNWKCRLNSCMQTSFEFKYSFPPPRKDPLFLFFPSWTKNGMISFLLRLLFHLNIFSPLKTKDLFHCHLKGDHTIKALLKAQNPVYLLWSLTWLPDNQSALLTMGPTTGSDVLGLCPLQRKWYLWLHFCLWEGRLFSALHGSLRKTAVLSGNRYTYTHTNFSSVPVSWLLRVCWISCHSDCFTNSVVLS